MRPKTGESPGAVNPRILLAFQERIYLLSTFDCGWLAKCLARRQ